MGPEDSLKYEAKDFLSKAIFVAEELGGRVVAKSSMPTEKEVKNGLIIQKK